MLKAQNRSLIIIEPQEQSSIFITLHSIGKVFPLYESVKLALIDIEQQKSVKQELEEINLAQAKSEKYTMIPSSETKKEIQSDEQLYS